MGEFFSLLARPEPGSVGERSDDYYQTRSGIAGFLMMAQGFAFMTRSTKDDKHVTSALRLFTLYFDEFWENEHPNDVDR